MKQNDKITGLKSYYAFQCYLPAQARFFFSILTFFSASGVIMVGEMGKCLVPLYYTYFPDDLLPYILISLEAGQSLRVMQQLSPCLSKVLYHIPKCVFESLQ